MPRKHPEAVRITTAPTARADDIAGRQRRYLVSMAIRTACFIGAVAVGPGWLRWVLIVGAVFLPYVAVVFANATPSTKETQLRPTDWFGRELPTSEEARRASQSAPTD